jgi:hypothetical protein
MADLDWQHVALQAGLSLLSGAGGMFFGIWKWGRRSAQQEQAVKDDYNEKIDGLREQMRASMADYAKAADAKNDLLVEQFKESFEGIRRQIDDHKLETERFFFRKEEFNSFREEYRQDMRRIFDKLDNLPRLS